MTDRSHRPTDREIISHGLELLRDGVLYSALPGKLIEEFGLTSERAHELAGEARQDGYQAD